MSLYYYRAFAGSSLHAFLAVGALGLGIASASVPGMIAGAAAYALGWIFLPDSRFFRGRIEAREERRLRQRQEREWQEYTDRRMRVLRTLTQRYQERYSDVERLCEDILQQLRQGDSPELADDTSGRLEGLKWSYLQMLSNDQRLAGFLRGEDEEDLQIQIRGTEKRLLGVAATSDAPSASRLRKSLEDTLASLRKREQQLQQAQGNLAVIRAEQTRIAEQLKALRGDLFMLSNTDSISERVNGTFYELAGTQRLLRELSPYDSALEDDVPPPPPTRNMLSE